VLLTNTSAAFLLRQRHTQLYTLYWLSDVYGE